MQKSELNRIMNAMIRAKEEEGGTVVSFQKNMIEAVASALIEGQEPVTLFGVKNTNQISRDLVKKLTKEKQFIFHTVDSMSDRGRAVDISCINPLTGKLMTGSSSGGCINILKGINDLAIGTDGGGSVLAPAISTQLYSIMGKGLGLMGHDKKVSTEGLSFVPGIGVISHTYSQCVQAIRILCDITDAEWADELASISVSASVSVSALMPLRVAIPVEGSIILPNGRDMTDSLEPLIRNFSEYISIEKVRVPNLQNRHESISFMNQLFEDGVDVMMTLEGPIDLYGYGDSIMGVWGETGQNEVSKSGKYLVKSANMINATAITIPTGELATGLVMLSKTGRATGIRLMKLGMQIAACFKRPALYENYFLGHEQSRDNAFGREV
ncbi:amidase family protein [Fusibacter sp. 3D3]|uniref:amidase family protein n=1 Tax=Fusibacter sp. 3D3 TaxID=1048380 RepID=UPI000855A7E0|nr:amidase family protein [Fusibacter sp. 3D3]GAU75487.1 putative amidase [Fusibacter sp. 3D3]